MIIAEKLKAKYPRIFDVIEFTWGTKDCYNYLIDLTLNSREGNREGFSFDVIMELTDLKEQHDKEFPQFNPYSGDPWAHN